MHFLSSVLALHNPGLLACAGLLLLGGFWYGLELFVRARSSVGQTRNSWILLASFALASALLWGHFLAYLAYDRGPPHAMNAGLMMLAWLTATVGFAAALFVAIDNQGPRYPLLGGAGFGLTLFLLTYIALISYRSGSAIEWNPPYVVLSLLFAAGFSMAAFEIESRSARLKRWAPLASLVAGAMLLFGLARLAMPGAPAMAVVPSDHEVFQNTVLLATAASIVLASTGAACLFLNTRTTQEMIDALEQIPFVDTLTGLPNRTSFGHHVTDAMRSVDGSGEKLAVIGIDLDRFKDVNDLYGNETGDKVLKLTSWRFRSLLREGEFIARTGGDEFAAAKRFREAQELQAFVDRLDAVVRQPISAANFDISIAASFGITVYPDDGDDPKRLLGNADLAMYRAKADVAHTCCFYEPQMGETARNRHSLGEDLEHAVELNQLSLLYQVQTSILTGEVCGHEVLLRWTHPKRGQISPATFIPIAEQTGSIIPIGEWVLKTACRAAASWETPHKIAINISALQLAHSDLPQLVRDTLTETGLEAWRLELELTESSLVADKVRALHVLRQIKAMGVTIAIDDFGTGYSSLGTLRSFPFDRIKLDRSFIHQMEGSAQHQAIVRAVLALGKSLQVKVLAEGVENRLQLEILAAEGCDEAQGFYFGRPSPRPNTLARDFRQDPIPAVVPPRPEATPATLRTAAALPNAQSA
jgi:diguanylate cyclase